MKKFFVALLVLAVMAGNLFAEATISGSLIGAWGVLSGTDEKDKGKVGQDGKADQPWVWDGPAGETSLGTIRARITIAGSSEDGKLGGWVQLRPGNASGGLATTWWKPIDQVVFTLGYIWGGGVYSAGVASADDTILNGDLGIIQLWGRGHGWSAYRGIQPWALEITKGFAVDLYPVDNLHIIAAVPFDQKYPNGGWGIDALTAAEVYANTTVKVDYTVPELLQIVAYFDGGTSVVDQASNANIDPAYIGGAVNVLAIPGLALSVGAAYPLPATTWYNFAEVEKTQKSKTLVDVNGDPIIETIKETVYQEGSGDIKVQDPIEIDLRANYTAGAFNVGFGLGVNLGGSVKVGSVDAVDTPLTLGVTLNPAYTLGNTAIGLVAEVKYSAEGKDKSPPSALGLNFVPYVQHNLGNGHVVLGFQVGFASVDQPDTKDVVTWSVPVGINYSF